MTCHRLLPHTPQLQLHSAVPFICFGSLAFTRTYALLSSLDVTTSHSLLESRLISPLSLLPLHVKIQASEASSRFSMHNPVASCHVQDHNSEPDGRAVPGYAAPISGVLPRFVLSFGWFGLSDPVVLY